MQSNRRSSKRKNKHPGVVKVRFIKQSSERQVPQLVRSPTFWPDRIDYVKAIAMRGLNDTEMAAYLGVSEALFDSWKAFYPLFAEAIESGRTKADAEVVAALHGNAVGFHYDTQEVVKTRHGGEIVEVQKYMPPDTQAQKFWLMNRSEHWRAGQNVQLGGQKNGKPADGITVESKQQVIHSILNLITPRPDGDGRAPRRVIDGQASKG